MDTAEEALRRIEIHEAECKLMSEMMEKRLIKVKSVLTRSSA